jgi:hypothetical protein
MNPYVISPAIDDFLHTLVGDQHRGTLFLAGGHRNGNRIPDWHDTPYDLARISLSRIAIDARKRSATEETYFSCALFAGEKRVEAQAVLFPFLFGDIDGGDLDGLPQPTVVLLSSPGRRQAFWKLHRATTREVATDLNRRLAAKGGADMSGWDSTQVLRMPGLPNHKYHGVVSRIESITLRTYDEEDFWWLPQVEWAAPAAITLTGGADGLAAWRAAYPYLSRKMRAVASGDDRAYGNDSSRADHALMCGLIAAGLTPDEAVAAFDVTPRGQALAARKGEERLPYLLGLSAAKAVALIGTVVTE